MSTTTNIITKQKQLDYNSGANAAVVSDAVDALHYEIVNIKLPLDNDGNSAATAENSQVAFTLPFAATLTSAYLSSTNAIDNAAADTIFVNVSVNAVSSIAFDSDDLAASIAANAVSALTVTEKDLAAGEVVLVAYAQQTAANNYLDGILQLNFRRA